MYYTVYKTTNINSGRIYIGVHGTNNILDDYLGSGEALRMAVRKYGRESFTKDILFLTTSREEAYVVESLIVTEEFVKSRLNYNKTIGGNVPPSWAAKKHSPQTIAKMKASTIRRGWTDDQRKEWSNVRRGKNLGDQNANYDETIYHFIHKDKTEFIGTRHEFMTAFDLFKYTGNISNLINGKHKHICGWSILSTAHTDH